MATYKVSNQAQLLSALAESGGHDTILLEGGNYGRVSLSGTKYGNATIRSADANDQAVFKGFVTNNVSNLTIDRVTFTGTSKGGYGEGTGIRLGKGSDVTIENSTFSSFNLGIQVWATKDVDIINNVIKDIAHDGIVLGHAHDVLIQGNDIRMNVRPGADHKDNIQFYNEGSLAPASDITIRGNSLSSSDGMTHGIYMGNADAKATGKLSEFYQDVLIENNSLATGQRLGIAIGQTDGLTIRGNEVLQHARIQSSKEINRPVVLVQEDARDVKVSGNIVLDAPSAANDGWRSVKAAAGWSLSSNKLVSLDTKASGAVKDAPSKAPVLEAPAQGGSQPGGSGDADDFRFNTGDKISGKRSVTFDGVDFDEGDRIILNKFEGGTFLDHAGGNIVVNNPEKTYVRIDSLTDLHEIVAASKRVTAHTQSNDTLVLHVEQSKGSLDILLPGLAKAYAQSFDADLF